MARKQPIPSLNLLRETLFRRHQSRHRHQRLHDLLGCRGVGAVDHAKDLVKALAVERMLIPKFQIFHLGDSATHQPEPFSRSESHVLSSIAHSSSCHKSGKLIGSILLSPNGRKIQLMD